jgi:cysteine-rich repeat protein
MRFDWNWKRNGPVAALFLLMVSAGMVRSSLDPRIWKAQIGNCSNGTLDAGEQCDDENLRNGDGCDNNCHIEKGWACRHTPSSCHQTICGDDLIDPGEQCDDGNKGGGDGCSDDCKIEAGWVCKGEPSLCHQVLCGDGIVDPGEKCDAGNGNGNNGCSYNCTVLPGWTCSGSPSKCIKNIAAVKTPAAPMARAGRTRGGAAALLQSPFAGDLLHISLP